MEFLYKLFCLAVGIFIITLFLYNHMRENVLLKKKVIEGNELSDNDVDVLSKAKGTIAQLKSQQASLLKQIGDAKKKCNRATKKLSDEKGDIEDAIDKTEKQADEAKSGKSTCD